MNTGLRVASNASMSTKRMPVVSATPSMQTPPMCATGNAIGYTSAAVGSNWSSQAFVPAITDGSVCHAPFGSAVDPDV